VSRVMGDPRPLQRVIERTVKDRLATSCYGRGKIAIEKLACGHTWVGPVRFLHGIPIGSKRRCGYCVDMTARPMEATP